MTITIEDRDLDREIARIASETGMSADEFVQRTLREKLVPARRRAVPMTDEDAAVMLAKIRRIQEEVARLPVLDTRSADEIMGYNENGTFD